MAVAVGFFFNENLYTTVMATRKLIVTHHTPDLDAVGAVWMLKRFISQEYATAKVAFVNPGESISASAAHKLGVELHQVTHVDTGLGEFDHHQEDRGKEFLSATLLTYQHACTVHPNLKNDSVLEKIVQFVTEIDHFQEVHWPEAGELRYNFMIHELIKGIEYQEGHTDETQLQFGMTCLDSAYSVVTQYLKAQEIITEEGEEFHLKAGPAMALETSNDETIKLAQKSGFILVVRKDPNLGAIRIKARPDADLTLEALKEAILKKDTVGTWYYHPSGKMLINGSRKHTTQQPSPLSLQEVVAMVKELYS